MTKILYAVSIIILVDNLDCYNVFFSIHTQYYYHALMLQDLILAANSDDSEATYARLVHGNGRFPEYINAMACALSSLLSDPTSSTKQEHEKLSSRCSLIG
jgi:hypothetical protein